MHLEDQGIEPTNKLCKYSYLMCQHVRKPIETLLYSLIYTSVTKFRSPHENLLHLQTLLIVSRQQMLFHILCGCR